MDQQFPHLTWIKNEQKHDRLFEDGQVFLIAIPVKNNKTGEEYWDIDKVQIGCDGEVAWMNYFNGDPYDSWAWPDVEYYIEVKQ